MGTQKPDLAQWGRELAQNQMPVFARTAQLIAQTAGDEDSSASELSRQILQDVSMTARLLRMANSIYFNPGGGKINTISRAIILLGFNVVRDLCLSISIIDTFLSGPNRDLVTKEMAHCFHAAMQAKNLAIQSRQKEPEEVFIATLLYHLGDLAFLCFAGRIDPPAFNRLIEARRRGEQRLEELERDILGFRIQDLTSLLNKEWRLSPLLATALDPTQQPSPRTQTIRLGHEIASAMGKGPGSPELEAVLRRAAKLLNLPVDPLRQQVWENAKTAAQTVASLGAEDAAQLIPRASSTDAADLAEVAGKAADAAPSASAAPAAAAHDANASGTGKAAPAVAPTAAATGSGGVLAAASPWPQPDPALQLDILRELSQLLVESKPNVSLLMEMVLEGVYRGVGMDRSVFALLTPDRTAIRAKTVLGSERDNLSTEFVFPLNSPKPHPIQTVLRSGEPAWVGGPGFDRLTAELDPRLKKLSGGECFLMPLWVAGTPIGCLYADRAPSRRALHDDLFNQFKLFGQQARLGLAYIKGR